MFRFGSHRRNSLRDSGNRRNSGINPAAAAAAMSFQNKNQGKASPGLAANAAAEALRRHSLDSEAAKGIGNFRANSMTRSDSMRSNSFSRQNQSMPRSNSMRSNSMTRTTTTVKRDSYGRTLSLTTTTVRQMGNFEIVTTKETPVRKQRPNRGSESIYSLESFPEEEEPYNPSPMRPSQRYARWGQGSARNLSIPAEEDELQASKSRSRVSFADASEFHYDSYDYEEPSALAAAAKAGASKQQRAPARQAKQPQRAPRPQKTTPQPIKSALKRRDSDAGMGNRNSFVPRQPEYDTGYQENYQENYQNYQENYPGDNEEGLDYYEGFSQDLGPSEHVDGLYEEESTKPLQILDGRDETPEYEDEANEYQSRPLSSISAVSEASMVTAMGSSRDITTMADSISEASEASTLSEVNLSDAEERSKRPTVKAGPILESEKELQVLTEDQREFEADIGKDLEPEGSLPQKRMSSQEIPQFKQTPAPQLDHGPVPQLKPSANGENANPRSSQQGGVPPAGRDARQAGQNAPSRGDGKSARAPSVPLQPLTRRERKEQARQRARELEGEAHRARALRAARQVAGLGPPPTQQRQDSSQKRASLQVNGGSQTAALNSARTTLRQNGNGVPSYTRNQNPGGAQPAGRARPQPLMPRSSTQPQQLNEYQQPGRLSRSGSVQHSQPPQQVRKSVSHQSLQASPSMKINDAMITSDLLAKARARVAAGQAGFGGLSDQTAPTQNDIQSVDQYRGSLDDAASITSDSSFKRNRNKPDFSLRHNRASSIASSGGSPRVTGGRTYSLRGSAPTTTKFRSRFADDSDDEIDVPPRSSYQQHGRGNSRSSFSGVFRRKEEPQPVSNSNYYAEPPKKKGFLKRIFGKKR